jgi:hypothetical protein
VTWFTPKSSSDHLRDVTVFTEDSPEKCYIIQASIGFGMGYMGVKEMLPKNVVMMREFERQNRTRLQKEAENTRLLQRKDEKPKERRFFPTWDLTREKVRLLRTLLNPAG